MAGGLVHGCRWCVRFKFQYFLRRKTLGLMNLPAASSRVSEDKTSVLQKMFYPAASYRELSSYIVPLEAIILSVKMTVLSIS